MTKHTTFPPIGQSGSLISALQGLISDPGILQQAAARSPSDTPASSFWGEENRSRKYGLDSPRSQGVKNGGMQGLSPSKSEECIKCMLKVPHRKCEAHKYIRIGGGYRHSYWYIKLIMEEIERQRQWELIRLQRLDAIQEKEVKAIKTYIRTKSGRLEERMIFVSAEDYEKMQKGDSDLAKQLLKKYLSADDAKNLQSWDKEEQRAIKTYIRTKSGRRVEKLVYVSKSDYEAMQRGDVDSNALLRKYVKTKKGERIEGWEQAEMRTIKTKVRTKSGRLIEKTIRVSKEDYDKLTKGGGDPETMARILGKYMPVGEGEKIESWEKEPKGAMKVIKTYVRTKSGRLLEKTALLTEEEYRQFQEAGGDQDMLRRLLGLGKDEQVEDWEKASTVYDVSDDEADKAKAGNRVIGKDGKVYEYCVDPVTGKKYKKRVNGVESDDSGLGSMPNKNAAFAPGRNGIIDEELGANASPEARERYLRGGRRPGSNSDYSYRSAVSAGGTRHVTRRRKRADCTYSDEESYHSDQDADGAKRRRERRKQRKEKFEKGKRREGSASDFSYRSVVSAGGTRRVKRRRRKEDGTYSAEESYHSSQDEAGEKRRQKRRKERKDVAKKAYKEGKRGKGSDSEFSYKSDVSAGGTRRVRRRRKKADGTYGDSESYHSSADEDGAARRRKRRMQRDQAEKKKAKAGKRMAGSESEYSYHSDVSAGGTRRVRRRRKKEDGTYSATESYHSSADEEGAARRRRRRRERKHGGSAHSYYSVVSAGGTRKVKRRRKREDGTYSDSESYHSSDNDSWADLKGKKQKGKNKKKPRPHGSDSEHSYFSEVSEGGTKHRVRRKRIRDAQGKVIGHGKTEVYTSGSEFSDQSTDDDDVDLSKMTEEEKKKYFEEKAKRKEAREKKRREKYGDKYEEMAARREAKKKFQSMVSYEKGGKRGLGADGKTDNRDPGMGHDEWSSKKGKKGNGGGKDGNEADSESEDDVDPVTGKRKKKKKKDGADSESEYETVVDEHGNVVVKKKKKKGKDGDSDSEYEYKYDSYGNLVKKKKEKKKKDGAEESDDGDYFEKGEDGKIRLKAGKRKIDLSKVTKDDLIALGIDPNLSKQEITRLLKEKFGDQIRVENKGRKVGLKAAADYGSDAGTDDLADDSDLDTSTLRGMRRVHVMMRRGGQPIIDHMKKVIDLSKLRDEPQHPDERDASIDFLTHFQLVDPAKLEPYARAFVVEDEDMDAVITYKDSRLALEAIPSVGHISKKQMDYVFKVLGIDENTEMTFRMFAVVTALSERVTHMDAHCKHLLEMSNLMDIERKLELYRMMFYCNVSSYRDPNYVTSESLRIELMAGGLSWDQQDYIMDKMMPNEFREISFLDYLCYIPLFLSMHDNICTNPLDMSTNKYTKPRTEVQRDMNPLGYPLKKDSVFLQKQRTNAMKKQAEDLLSGKKPSTEMSKAALDMFNNKYQKLPNIIGK